jgi:predicted exporter
VWLLLTVAAIAYNGKIWLVDHRSLETDFMALLPSDENDPVVRQAIDRVAESAEQNVLVLVGAPDWTRAQAAGRAYSSVLARHAEWFRPASLTAMTSDSALAPWWNNRRSLLTPQDRDALRSGSADDWARRAMQDVMSPMGTGRIGAWQDDPFGLFRRWLQARAAITPVRPIDGMLRVDDGDLHYAVLPMQMRSQAFALQSQRDVVPLFAEARDSALHVGADVRVLAAGVVFPAAAAAAQANHELNTIGWGSILGIILITWITFRSLRPIGLILLSLAVGTIGAVAVTALWYPKVHLLTLVFGASLIGLAEDYGTHYLCMSERTTRGALAVMWELLPSLAFALLTTVVSFFGLALSPFPGLQQIAVFSAVGLVSAWVTVVLWFPPLAGAHVGRPSVVAWFNNTRARWRVIARGRAPMVVGVISGLACVVGVMRVRPNDDIRLLQSLPEAMLHEQSEVSRILQVPFGAQFYVVRAPSDTMLLAREEALRERLDSLVERGTLNGYQAVSSWVPSPSRQRTDAALVEGRLWGQDGALVRLQTALGEGPRWADDVRARSHVAAATLTASAWLSSPVSEPLRPLWLGQVGPDWVTVVSLKGVENAQLSALAALARGMPGVQWIDKISSISSVLGRYRARMGWILAASYLVIWLIFLPRYGRLAWRLLAPSVCASVASIAVLGVLGQPLQLFHVLALYLVFGLGVDYAIFLIDHRESENADVWFAVGLAAISTVLSFGLLALSATPVLRAFGLTMLVGTTVSLFAAPIFCTIEARDVAQTTPPASPSL